MKRRKTSRISTERQCIHCSFKQIFERTKSDKPTLSSPPSSPSHPHGILVIPVPSRRYSRCCGSCRCRRICLRHIKFAAKRTVQEAMAALMTPAFGDRRIRAATPRTAFRVLYTIHEQIAAFNAKLHCSVRVRSRLDDLKTLTQEYYYSKV